MKFCVSTDLIDTYHIISLLKRLRTVQVNLYIHLKYDYMNKKCAYKFHRGKTALAELAARFVCFDSIEYFAVQ